MLHQSNYAKGLEPIPYPAFAGSTIKKRFVFPAPATLAANDIIELAPIPDNLRVLDVTLVLDDLDTDGAPTLLLDAGVMSGEFGVNDDTRTCGDEFFDGTALGRAGGVERMSAKTGFSVGVSGTVRSIGIKVATAAATPAAGNIIAIVEYATE